MRRTSKAKLIDSGSLARNSRGWPHHSPETPGDCLEREEYLKRCAEALSATTVLRSKKMTWLHTCPDTWQHWHCFVAIMVFCRKHIHEGTPQSVQAFMLNSEFPSSMRAWSIMPWVALNELRSRGRLPRFLSLAKAPDCVDPGDVNLDVTFYVLCLWEFVTPEALQGYGARGKNSSQGPIEFRVLQALKGFCHERAIHVRGGYHAGRLQKTEPASSSQC